MTPEEAKPIEMIDECGKPTLWFTAKEAAEIAAAYSESEKSDPDEMVRWREKFKEWSE